MQHRNRISHTKSRNGCYTCKGRRVKCDEARPTCGACDVRGSQCTYPSPGSTRNRPRCLPSRGSNGPVLDTVPNHHDTRARSGEQEYAISPLSFNLGPAAPGLEVDSLGHLNMNDLNLLQHYILHTSRKMSFNREKTLVWQRVFPEIAGTNEFLMHLLLALAGLDAMTEQFQGHRKGNNPIPEQSLEQAKLRVVIEHHQLGLKGLQDELRSASESNAEVLMTGSMLIVGFAFASLRFGNLTSSDSHPSPGDPYTDPDPKSAAPQTHWLRLVRGVSSITQQHWMTVKTGRCRVLLQFRNAHEDWKLTRSDLDGFVPVGTRSKITKFASGAGGAVSRLRVILYSLEAAEQSSDSERSAILKEQHLALTVFEEMHMCVLYALRLQRVESRPSSDVDFQAEIEEAAVTSWPTLVSQEFISSLESYEHFGIIEGLSFVILAHLYMTLAILEDTWYLGVTFDAEIDKINHLVCGLKDAQLAKLMEWPMELIHSS